jgi:hypothetical protein
MNLKRGSGFKQAFKYSEDMEEEKSTSISIKYEDEDTIRTKTDIEKEMYLKIS